MNKRTFGIELEVATKKRRKEVIDALKAAGINAEGDSYSGQASGNTWKVKPDGSINGWEIVSPPLTDTEELEKVVHVLRKELHVRCNYKTGLHLHHDISDLPLKALKNLFEIYDKYEQNAIKSIIAKTRQTNSYCEPLAPIIDRVKRFETMKDLVDKIPSRYYNLNIKAFIKFGTIEFRHHQGTTDIKEILAWIELTRAMVETAKLGYDVQPIQSTNKEDALDEMLKEMKLDNNKFVVRHYKKVQKFIEKRAIGL